MRSDSGSQARIHPLVGDRGFWNSEGLAEVAPIVEIMSSEFPGSAERHGDANSQQYPLRVECVGVQPTDRIAFRT